MTVEAEPQRQWQGAKPKTPFSVALCEAAAAKGYEKASVLARDLCMRKPLYDGFMG